MKNSGIEWIGEIPDEWETKTIKQVLIERIEKNSEYQTNTILSLSAKDGVTLYDGEHHAGNRPREDLSDYKVVYPNDIVANSMNILSGSLGLSAYMGCVSPVYYIYYPRFNDNIEYLHYIFQCKQFQLSLRGLGNGILIKESENGNLNTIRMRIPSQKLAAQAIPHCHIDTQKRIVDFLNQKLAEVDKLIGIQQAQVEKLKEYKQSVITEAVTKGLDPTAPMKDSGIPWIGNIPASWEVIRGKNLFRQRNERGNEECLQLLSPTQHYGVIPQTLYDKISGMTAVKLSLSTDLSTMKTIHKGDFCISLRSFQGGFEYSTYEGVVSPAYQVFFAFAPIYDGFYKYLFKEKGFIAEMNSFTLTIRDGKNIAFGDFANSDIVYPPITEQQQIADYLDEKCSKIDEVISLKQQKIEKLQEYKKSLIYEYVTGKKEVV